MLVIKLGLEIVFRHMVRKFNGAGSKTVGKEVHLSRNRCFVYMCTINTKGHNPGLHVALYICRMLSNLTEISCIYILPAS